MDFHDYYDTLGVAKGSSQEEIQRAYKKKARKLHPDVNKEEGAEDRFKKLGEAYEVLKDPDKRAKYDRFGQAWKQAQAHGGGGQPGWEKVRVQYGPGFDRDFGNAEDFGSLFEELFGGGFGAGGGNPFGGAGGGFRFEQGGRPRPRPRRGANVEADVEVTLEEAARGGKRQFTLSDPTTGERQTIEVSIPAGIRAGKKLRLSGKGGDGLGGGPKGDLLLRIRVLPHPRFRLDGDDLTVDLKVAPWEAALGAEAEVPTLDGGERVRIPAGTSSGAKIRLRGKGFPAVGGKETGDLYAVVNVAVPKRLSDRERELFESLAEESEFRPRG
ncbi:MAG TPA: DnaJ C-terminal domain-containing protein [Thermoanaerobaculia bacterium]|nr:DnaJ C-terminal domain-containing protein [Thermoanaerobaculia bacterium]